MDLRFYKLRVCDSDLLLVDDFEGNGRDRDWGAAARLLLDRRMGAGAERLAVLAKAESAIWLRVFGRDGRSTGCIADAALCAARYLLDSGRAERDTVPLRVPGGALTVDVLPAASLGLSLGPPRGVPDGKPLDQEAAAARRSVIESEGERFEVLPIGLAIAVAHPTGSKAGSGEEATNLDAEAIAVFYEGGAKAARARIRASTRGAAVPDVLPLRLVSREEIWTESHSVGGKGGASRARAASHPGGRDAATTAALALAASAAAGYAERGALVRLRGGAMWVEWTDKETLYVAGRPEYVYRGEFHMDEAEAQPIK